MNNREKSEHFIETYIKNLLRNNENPQANTQTNQCTIRNICENDNDNLFSISVLSRSRARLPEIGCEISKKIVKKVDARNALKK